MPYLDDSISAAATLLKRAVPPDSMEKMTFAQLRKIRESTQDMDVQNYVAPFEHGAMAREATAEGPLATAVGLAVATPVYTAAKALGLKTNGDPNDTVPQSAASFKEMNQTFKGIYQGLREKVTKR